MVERSRDGLGLFITGVVVMCNGIVFVIVEERDEIGPGLA